MKHGVRAARRRARSCKSDAQRDMAAEQAVTRAEPQEDPRLVVIEALMGQIMLVVLVARLVSLWGHLSPKAHDAAVGQFKEAVQARREGAVTALAAAVSAGQSANANVDGETSADPVADTSTPAETSTPEDQSKASDTVGETRSSPGPDDNPENPSEKSSGEQ